MISAPFSARTALAVVIANMIGTGVFTSLGFQLLEIQSGFVILMLWLVGGITALCGALSYAELGASLPRSGGEYNFLSEIYHPGVGFVAGWVSATIGFAAPTALAAITFGTYLASVVPSLSPRWLATSLILVLAAAHATTRRTSGGTQRAFTYLKVVLIAAFCLLGWTLADAPQDISFLPAAGDGTLIASGAFAVALIYVNYAYTGWNAATYVIDELDRPEQTLSRVLLTGTTIVLVLYLLLNFTFLYVAPIDALAGRLEIAVRLRRYRCGDHGHGTGASAGLNSKCHDISRTPGSAGDRAGLHRPSLPVPYQLPRRTCRRGRPAIGFGRDLGADGHVRIHPDLCRVHLGRKHALHRGRSVRPPMATSGTRATLPGTDVSAAAARLPGTHGIEGLAGLAILASGAVFYALSRRVSNPNGTNQTRP